MGAAGAEQRASENFSPQSIDSALVHLFDRHVRSLKYVSAVPIQALAKLIAATAGQFRTRSVRFTMNNLYIVVLIALAGIALAATDAEPITAKSVQANGVKAYVYNPLLLGTNGTMKSDGGSTQRRMVAQWPQLAGQGISQTAFTLEPCALRPAHVHPRATGLLYLISGAKFMVGFVTEDGVPVNNEISTGASAVFPVGLVHYQQNLDCYEATYTISYNSEDPGTQMTYAALQGLPNSAAAATLGVTESSYLALKAATNKGTFIKSSDPDCVARCQLRPFNSTATVSAASIPSSG